MCNTSHDWGTKLTMWWGYKYDTYFKCLRFGFRVVLYVDWLEGWVGLWWFGLWWGILPLLEHRCAIKYYHLVFFMYLPKTVSLCVVYTCELERIECMVVSQPTWGLSSVPSTRRGAHSITSSIIRNLEMHSWHFWRKSRCIQENADVLRLQLPHWIILTTNGFLGVGWCWQFLSPEAQFLLSEPSPTLTVPRTRYKHAFRLF